MFTLQRASACPRRGHSSVFFTALLVVAILLRFRWARVGNRNPGDNPSVVIDAEAAGAVADGQTDNLDTLTDLFDSAPKGATVHLAPELT